MFQILVTFLRTDNFKQVINAFADAINHVNFNFDDTPPQPETCEEGTPKYLPGAECLPIGISNNLTTTAQLFDICTQLELAIEVHAGSNPTQAEAID